MSFNYNIAIVLSFIGLWITSFISGELEIIMGFVLIFSFGILHGSNDILLLNSLYQNDKKNIFKIVLSYYLVTILFSIVFFYFFPLITLILFIIFSAYHFGEQHFENKILYTKKNISFLFYIIYGLFILNLLFVFNIESVTDVVFNITSIQLSNVTLKISFIINSIIMISFFIYLFIKSNYDVSLIKEVFYLIIFSIIFKVSTLIWGFTIYFILWHSLPSLNDQIGFIYGDLNKTNTYKYLKDAFPYWLIAIFGIIITYLLFRDQVIFYAIFFSFLAAITFPHSIVMNKMFTDKKKRNLK